MSSDSLSSEEFIILKWLAKCSSNNSLCRLFEYNPLSNELKVLYDLPLSLTIEQLIEKLDSLIQRELVTAAFDRKVLKCPRCSKLVTIPHTACPSCSSEDILKSEVYLHSCGVFIPGSALDSISRCPKCREILDKHSFTTVDYRFICKSCGSIFVEPACRVECPSCGWLDDIKKAEQFVLKKYTIGKKGYEYLESADPAKRLVRKLILDGFYIREKVKLVGQSGVTYTFDIVATRENKSETRVYVVLYKIEPSDIITLTVKKLDVERSNVKELEGEVVKWVVAGLQISEDAVKAGQSFGIEVEKI